MTEQLVDVPEGRGGVLVARAGPAGHEPADRVQGHLGQQLTGGGFTHRPGVAGVVGPAVGGVVDVIQIGLAEVGQRRPVVDPVVVAQATQVPLAVVDLYRFHQVSKMANGRPSRAMSGHSAVASASP